MKIVFISDFFVDEIKGGAELVDSHLIDLLVKNGFEIEKIKSNKVTESFLKNNFEKTFLISNFAGLNPKLINLVSALRYFIFEHDHKYTADRDVSIYKDFIVPQNRLINLSFYQNAQYIFCQSKIHAEVVQKNIKTNNVINLGCSIWSDEELDILEKASKKEKTKEYAIVNSNNPIKSTQKSVSFCKKNNLQYELIGSHDYTDFIKQLSPFKTLVFFPKVLESFCRLVVEARMLNCSLKTNSNLGCTSESWFKDLRGSELVDFVKNKREEIITKISDSLREKDKSTFGDLTVILNAYRRPYNLKMQVDALKKQTVKPKQIWLWVNDHPENRDFDFTTLGVDRIFHNDHNWKFYGRFAAALLADTDYVGVFDDDTIPGERWFENCFETINTHEGILGSAGYIQTGPRALQYEPERAGWPRQNRETMRVDYVGHAWFFKREWLSHLWREKPPTWDNGEDIHFSYTTQKYGGLQTYCPPHPPEDKSLHGSLLGYELGVDSKATSNNQAVSHQQFFSERDHCINNSIVGGWNTVNSVKAEVKK